MVNGIYVIHRYSTSPLFSAPIIKDEEEFNNGELVSGLMGAIIQFGEHIQIGQITNFDSLDHRVVVASSTNNILSVVYDPKRHTIQDPHSLAAFLLTEFENNYPDLREETLPTDFDTTSFDKTVNDALSLNLLPFFYRVVKFAKKEFGGEAFINQEAFTGDEKPVTIDIMLDRGIKQDKALLDRVTNRIVGGDFAKDIVYVKVIDGQAGSGEIKEFFDLCSTFGRRRAKSDIPSYFPSLVVIVAKAYSPTVPRILDKLMKKGKNHILTPQAAPSIAKLVNKPPKSHQCYIQMWKWDGKFPDLMYE